MYDIAIKNRKRLIVAAVLAAPLILAFIVVMIGRLPVGGTICIDSNQSDRFAQMMKDRGMNFWTGIGGLGGMQVRFDNPISLCEIDDELIADAKKNNYRLVIEYECVIPYLSHTVTVN